MQNAGFPEPVLVASACFADSTVWKNKSLVWKGCCREKKLHFCITLFVENERETSEQNRGLCFSMKLKVTCKN